MSVFVSDDVKRKNPNFSKLIDQLELKMNATAMSKVESKFWLAKTEWLEEHVVYATVQLVFNEIQFKILHNEITEDEVKAWKAVMRCFYLTQCPDSFQISRNIPARKFDSQFLKSSSDYNEGDLNMGKSLLAFELEKKLEVTAFKLIDARDGPDANENSKIRLARSLQIGTILKDDKAALYNNQQRLKQLNIDEMNSQNEYHQVLRECSDLLVKLITKYCLRLQPLKDQAIVKNALISCETLAAKLKSIRADLVCETYTPQALEVLKKLRSEIVATIQLRERELSDVEEQLEIYHRLGSDFEAIAKEYGQAKNDLEKQQWTLSEVKEKLKKS